VASVMRHASLHLEDFLKAVKKDLDDFIAGQDPFDDITLVALEVL
jgi:serine phosphatase RsbU (regulator of sigma subunit)